MKRLLLPAALLLASTTAWADLVPPDREDCLDKQVGASCELDERNGTCQQSRCSRLDYSNGTPPTTVEHDCLKCVPLATPATPVTPAASGETKSSSCAAAPGAPLALTVLLAGWLARNKRRGA